MNFSVHRTSFLQGLLQPADKQVRCSLNQCSLRPTNSLWCLPNFPCEGDVSARHPPPPAHLLPPPIHHFVLLPSHSVPCRLVAVLPTNSSSLHDSCFLPQGKRSAGASYQANSLELGCLALTPTKLFCLSDVCGSKQFTLVLLLIQASHL